MPTYRFDRDRYLNTPQGLLALHRCRSRRRLHFSIDGVQPRSKDSMRDGDKDEVQRQFLKRLADMRRRAFRGPLALQLTLGTTGRNPTHSHNIAKNLLDLFREPRPGLGTRRRRLLYADDSQVHALTLACHHGQDAPEIFAVATPLGGLLTDLDLATQFIEEHHADREEARSYELDMAIDQVRDLQRNEAGYRHHLGDRGFEAMLRFSRKSAQEHLLGRAALTPFDLARLYNVSGRAFGIDLAAMWENIFASSPLRIHLSELPQVTGASAQWEREIDSKLRVFQTHFGWLVDPLLVPVALEVVIKPPPPSRQNGLHDLDNVLRRYLIPRVVGILKPVSHYAFTLDATAAKESPKELKIGGKTIHLPTPPASTKSGVTRYEAWRLPPAAEGEQGFVSVAIVADLIGDDDTLCEVDDAIGHWRESLDSRSHLSSARWSYSA